MKNSEHQSLEQIRAFLEGNEEVGFKAASRKEGYEWTQATLCAQEYVRLPRRDKGLVKRYISKVTGMSRAQATRLITQYVGEGTIRVRRGRGKRFTAHYTPADVALLAEVDEAHETLSGPATRKILLTPATSDIGAHLQPAEAAQLPRTSDRVYQNSAHADIDRGTA